MHVDMIIAGLKINIISTCLWMLSLTLLLEKARCKSTGLNWLAGKEDEDDSSSENDSASSSVDQTQYYPQQQQQSQGYGGNSYGQNAYQQTHQQQTVYYGNQGSVAETGYGNIQSGQSQYMPNQQQQHNQQLNTQHHQQFNTQQQQHNQQFNEQQYNQANNVQQPASIHQFQVGGTQNGHIQQTQQNHNQYSQFGQTQNQIHSNQANQFNRNDYPQQQQGSVHNQNNFEQNHANMGGGYPPASQSHQQLGNTYNQNNYEQNQGNGGFGGHQQAQAQHQPGNFPQQYSNQQQQHYPSNQHNNKQSHLSGYPPQQEVAQEENWKQKGEINPWLGEGPKDVTSSSENEKYKQEKFAGMKTKWDYEKEDAEKQAKLSNTQGQVVYEKAYLTKEELANGGKAVQHQAVITAGLGPQMVLQQHQINSQPQINPQPNQINSQPHQPQPYLWQGQGDPTFQFASKDYYKGKIQDMQTNKLLAQSYEIPKRTPRPKPESKHPPSPIRGNQNLPDNPNNPQPHGRQSHLMDDPPGEIMYKPRWFDDSEYDAENSASSYFVTTSKVLLYLISILLYIKII